MELRPCLNNGRRRRGGSAAWEAAGASTYGCGGAQCRLAVSPGSVAPPRAARRAPEEALGAAMARVLTMRPSLDVAVPRAEEQLTAAQHLLLVGSWLPQRPRRAWAARHSRRGAIVNHGAPSWRQLYETVLTPSSITSSHSKKEKEKNGSVNLGYHMRCHTRYELGTHTHQHKKHHHSQTAPRRTRTRYSKTPKLLFSRNLPTPPFSPLTVESTAP